MFEVQVWNPSHKKDITPFQEVQRRGIKLKKLRNISYKDRLNKLNLIERKKNKE